MSVGGYCTSWVGSCDWVLCSNAIKVSLNHSFSKQQRMKLMQIYGRGMWVILEVTFSQTLAKSSGSKADYCNLSRPSAMLVQTVHKRFYTHFVCAVSSWVFTHKDTCFFWWCSRNPPKKTHCYCILQGKNIFKKEIIKIIEIHDFFKCFVQFKIHRFMSKALHLL